MNRALQSEELELLLDEETFTLEQIDEALTQISAVIKYSKRANIESCHKRANKWLDRRMKHMTEEELSAYHGS